MASKESILRLVKNLLLAALLYMLTANFYEYYKVYEFEGELKSNPYYRLNAQVGHLHSKEYSVEIYWPEHPDGKFSMRTNNFGFKEDQSTPLIKNKNTRRILITGDSHTDGVVNNNESFPNLLEDLLNAETGGVNFEVINGGSGFYSFKNYAGLLEKFKILTPDVYVVTVYTGNDFIESIFYEPENLNFFTTSGNFYYRLKKQMIKWRTGLDNSQYINQLVYFNTFPSMQQKSNEIAKEYFEQIRATCIANNIELLVVLLPPKVDVHDGLHKHVQQVSGWSEVEMSVIHDLKNNLKSSLNAMNIATLDLEAEFAKSEEALYWNSDHHLNNLGHALTAKILHSTYDWRSIDP